MERDELPARPPIRVGIVGAGFAGLRCTDVLLQRGCKVSIFEARDRIGGRVAQSNHLGHLVDLGPNWIHGTGGNPISRIAKQAGTYLHAWKEEQVVIDGDGTRLSNDETEEYVRLLWDDGLIADAFKYSEDHCDLIDPDRSLYDFFVEKAEGMFLHEPANVAAKKRQTLLHLASEWGAYIGSPIQRQSLKFFWLEQCIEGENPFATETYRPILDAVARNAVESAELNLEHRVISIRTSIEDDLERRRRPIIETDKKIAEFDAVVVTTPLGWLKRNQHAFKPPLESRLSKAIDSIGYGTLEKVYISFPSAFWDVPLPGNQSITNGIDPESKTPNVTATTMPLHQPPSHDTEDHYPGFVQWLSPAYALATNPRRWGQQGVNLAALPAGFAHPTLLFYIYGECSEHIANLVGSGRNDKECDSELIEFFKPYYSTLPNYDETSSMCKPKAVLATAWSKDEFAGFGSYSNFQIGLEHGDTDIETMRYGMPERRVWFAGEHTAPFEALGTTTGAYISGERVAKSIVASYGLQKSHQ